MYRKRNVVPAVLELYASPYVTSGSSGGSGKQRGAGTGAVGKTDDGKAKGSSNNRIKEKALELLWNMAGIEGGGTTLITRHGVFSWIEGQIADEADEGVALTLRRLAARIWESCDQRYVQEWSHGGIRARLVDGEGVFSINRTVE